MTDSTRPLLADFLVDKGFFVDAVNARLAMDMGQVCVGDYLVWHKDATIDLTKPHTIDVRWRSTIKIMTYYPDYSS